MMDSHRCVEAVDAMRFDNQSSRHRMEQCSCRQARQFDQQQLMRRDVDAEKRLELHPRRVLFGNVL